MKTFIPKTRYLTFVAALVLVSGLLAVGCTDSVVDPDAALTEEAGATLLDLGEASGSSHDDATSASDDADSDDADSDDADSDDADSDDADSDDADSDDDDSDDADSDDADSDDDDSGDDDSGDDDSDDDDSGDDDSDESSDDDSSDDDSANDESAGFEVNAEVDLAATMADPLASGKAKFEIRSDRTRFSTEVEDVTLDGEGEVRVLRNSEAVFSGGINIVLGFGDLNRDSRDGDVVPAIESGDDVEVYNADGALILAGTFN